MLLDDFSWSYHGIFWYSFELTEEREMVGNIWIISLVCWRWTWEKFQRSQSFSSVRGKVIINRHFNSLWNVTSNINLLHFSTVAKKTHTMIQKLKKEGKLSSCLLKGLLNCRTLEELDHVVSTLVFFRSNLV